MNAPVLQLRDIQKRFPGVHALRGVNLDLYAGEVVGLLGENGAGKSTLMKILGGIEQPESGSILIDGVATEMRDVRTATAHGIALIHQELNLVDTLDVAGNILLGREPTGWGRLRLVDHARMRAAVRPYLDQVGLDVSPDTPVAGLSIAQQQLVEIAKALSLRARVLVMDEPTSSQTLAETARLHRVVADLRQRGVAIIYITHRLSEVEAIADRAVVLRDGANAGALSREAITHEAMVGLMVGRALEVDAPTGHRAGQGRDRLVVDGLRTRRYPQHPVSFSVGAGEILGISGLVGAGRSEVAQAIFGVDPPLSGRVTVDGTEIRCTSPSEAIDHGVFLVPEDRRSSGLVVESSIRENVSLPALHRYARLGLVSEARESAAVAAICGSLQVKAPSLDVKAATLSGGNQQKVVLAKWLALGPKVLIIDEPTRGIDVGAKADIYRLLRALAEQGVSIVMISSDMEEVLHLGDRVAVMHEGRVTGILTRDACTESGIMALAVGGPAVLSN